MAIETNGRAEQKGDFLLPASIIVAGVLVAGSIVYVLGNKSGAPQAPAGQRGDTSVAAGLALTPRDAVLGSASAPVTFIEYGDYQCPFCARFFTDVEPAIREAYVKTGKVKLVFRNFQFLGPESIAAGEAAECANDEHQFWAYHDALYAAKVADEEKNPQSAENDGTLNRALFLKIAGDLGLDANAFARCIDSGARHADVLAETDVGRAVGVQATPTAFVNGTMIQGMAPQDQRFTQAIEAALKAASTTAR